MAHVSTGTEACQLGSAGNGNGSQRMLSEHALNALSEIVSLPREDDERVQYPAVLGKSLMIGDDSHAAEIVENSHGALSPASIAGVVNVQRNQAFMKPEYGRLSPPVAFLNIEADDDEGFAILGEPPAWERAHCVAKFARDHALDGRRVLVHSREGRNRNVALAVAVVMLNERCLLLHAVKDVWDKRPFILQNASFRKQLVLLAEQEGLLGTHPSLPVMWNPNCETMDKVELLALDRQIVEAEGKLKSLISQRDQLLGGSNPVSSMENVCVLRAAHVKVGQKLGSGFFGVVYSGSWRGFTMALKFCEQEAGEALKRECALMSTLEHPNIVKIYGICVGTPPDLWPEGVHPPCLCCELLTGGTLLEYLQNRKAEDHYAVWHWKTLLGILVDSANGLAYLHSQGVMHRDLKSENIFLDKSLNAKIADFGLSRVRSKTKRHSISIGTYSHMAPEVLTGQYALSCDVFSLGITITEVLTSTVAEDIIDQTRTDEFGLKKEGLLAFFDPILHDPMCFKLIDLAMACCDIDPLKRPFARSLPSKLTALLIDSDVEGREENALFHTSVKSSSQTVSRRQPFKVKPKPETNFSENQVQTIPKNVLGVFQTRLPKRHLQSCQLAHLLRLLEPSASAEDIDTFLIAGLNKKEHVDWAEFLCWLYS